MRLINQNYQSVEMIDFGKVRCNAEETVNKELKNLKKISLENINRFSVLCKYAICGSNLNNIISKIDEMAYHLYISDIWKDLVYCNYNFIYNFLSISRCAIRYAHKYKLEKFEGLKSVIDNLNGPYLMSTEWLPVKLSEFNLISQDLGFYINKNDKIKLTTMFKDTGIWKWTDENYEDFKSYMLTLLSISNKKVLSQNYDEHLKSVSDKLLIAAIVKQDIKKMVDLLLIHTLFKKKFNEVMKVALDIIRNNKIDLPNALSLIMILDSYKKVCDKNDN